MKIIRRFPGLAILSVVLITAAQADSLEKRHQIGLRLGMWNQVTDVRTEIGAGLVSTSVESGGFMGAVGYGHWLQENLALDLSAGLMALDVETRVGVSGVSSRTATVSTILFGLKYYFPKSTLNSNVRPYAKAAVGPFVGNQTEENVGWVITTESRTETALGGQMGLGVDFILGRHFMIGTAVGYNLMTDFEAPIGGSENYSGPQFAIGFGYLFGKGTS